MGAERRLAGALAGADHRDHGNRRPSRAGAPAAASSTMPGARYSSPASSATAASAKRASRIEHRLAREVDTASAAPSRDQRAQRVRQVGAGHRRPRARSARRDRRAPPRATFSSPPANSTAAISCSCSSESSAARTTPGMVLAVYERDDAHRAAPLTPTLHRGMPEARLLVLVRRLARPLDDRLLLVERIPAHDPHGLRVDLDHVVTGARVAAQPQRRDGAGRDHEQVLEPPRVGHVLVAGEHEVDARAQQDLEQVAGVVDDVALAAGARAPAAGGGAARRCAGRPAAREALLDRARSGCGRSGRG